MSDQAIHLVQELGEPIEIAPYLGVVRPGDLREDGSDRRQQHARETGGGQGAGNVGKPLTLTQMLAQSPADQPSRDGLKDRLSPALRVCHSGAGSEPCGIQRR